MADYFAVLQRTLSGFSDPKPELRTKLYERARITIARQLENRTPTVTGEALAAELDKLERAIGDIERGFDPSYREPAQTPDAATEQVSDANQPAEQSAPTATEEATNADETIAPAAQQVDSDSAPLPSVSDPAGDAATQSLSEPIDPALNEDAVDQWGQEFLSQQAGLEQTAETSPDQPGQPKPVPVAIDTQFSASGDDTLVIPPAPGFGNGGKQRSKSRGFLKWFLVLLLLAGLGAAGAYGWMNKELVLEAVGMSDLLDDPVRPKPVKTITIKPEPEPELSEETTPIRKVESRLNENGQEVQEPTADQPTTPSVQPVIETPAIAQPTTGVPPVAQNAILYEEGATAADNTVDAGRVVWSVVQETPANSAAPEPAIRARIEIPDRNVVLIMTIKRNTDKALPASHLIELVFAVPEDFSGGAIGQINRFVLKESEQGRGEGLIGVPARIADGIFLIALNNLDQAKTKNVNLLKTRDWFDIPMQYRTGRRALMTIEKGLPGANVFKEVFDAWDKL